jgi:hypothetical protein
MFLLLSWFTLWGTLFDYRHKHCCWFPIVILVQWQAIPSLDQLSWNISFKSGHIRLITSICEYKNTLLLRGKWIRSWTRWEYCTTKLIYLTSCAIRCRRTGGKIGILCYHSDCRELLKPRVTSDNEHTGYSSNHLLSTWVEFIMRLSMACSADVTSSWQFELKN